MSYFEFLQLQTILCSLSVDILDISTKFSLEMQSLNVTLCVRLSVSIALPKASMRLLRVKTFFILIGKTKGFISICFLGGCDIFSFDALLFDFSISLFIILIINIIFYNYWNYKYFKLYASSQGSNSIEDEQSKLKLFKLNEILKCNKCRKECNDNNRPRLYQCGHCLCNDCIIINKDDSLMCPIDMKRINTDSNLNKKIKCLRHNCIKTHYIESTKEIICIYCALEMMKSNPTIDIKEIKVKSEEISNSMYDEIDFLTSKISVIEKYLRDNKHILERETNKINKNYTTIIESILIKKQELINQINDIYKDNEKKLTSLLESYELLFNAYKKIIERLNQWKTSPFVFIEDLNTYEQINKMKNGKDNIIQYKESQFINNNDDVIQVDLGHNVINTKKVFFSLNERKKIRVNKRNTEQKVPFKRSKSKIDIHHQKSKSKGRKRQACFN